MRAQRVNRGLVFRRIDHEGVVHAVRHLERPFDDWGGTLDQQHADAAGIEEGDALVRPLAQELAADDLGIEFDAAVDVADRNAEMRDALDVGMTMSCCDVAAGYSTPPPAPAARNR